MKDGFFLFKQKTAYEMRISDWSSDVCSSDLLFVLVARPVAGDVDVIVADFERQVRNGGIEVEQPRHVGLGFERDVPEIITGHDEKIGNASGRERVFQYV